MNRLRFRRPLALRVISVLMACLCVGGAMLDTAVPVVRAQTALEDKYDELQSKLTQDKAALATINKQKDAAAAKKKNLESQVSTIKSQIALLAEDIATVQNDIGETEQEIAQKQTEIDEKQAEYDSQFSDFKSRMGAMQELHDGGTIAMLGSVTNLYQLLTFSEMLQDISTRDNEIMDEIEAMKTDLEEKKAALEEEKAELETKQAELEEKKTLLSDKQGELTTSLNAAGMELADAEAAAKEAQELVDTETEELSAIRVQINEAISLTTGFICPLRSYTRISSTYGTRTDPISGSSKFHGGIDFAAPYGTTIRACAAGRVVYAGWNSGGYGNCVIIYHGTNANDGKEYTTLYGHMSSVSVSYGGWVEQGAAIGAVGSTGKSTGNHLHLEVWQGQSTASRVNPAAYVPC